MSCWPQELNFGLCCTTTGIRKSSFIVLGAQVNVRSNILGALKGAKEAQREFPISMEDFIRQSDISRSVQLAIGETKVRLDLAISLTKLLDWITTIDREKSHVRQMFENTDYALKLYNRALSRSSKCRTLNQHR